MVETPEEEAAGREKWSRLLKQAPSMPIEERIPLLQSAILKLSQPSIYADREKAEPLFRQARDLMAATPGYGDYYVRTLGGMQEEAIKSGPAWNQFHTDCDYALATLKLVPTAESVRALSELLDYDKTRDVPMEGGPLAGRAAYALFNMIENPPARGYHVPWKQWRERVREGRETFQLKGSEIRYNFEGPIETTDIQPDRGSPPLPTGHALPQPKQQSRKHLTRPSFQRASPLASSSLWASSRGRCGSSIPKRGYNPAGMPGLPLRIATCKYPAVTGCI